MKICFFFFSSRRRHTRLQGDWSSDVCSSDLGAENASNLGRGDYDNPSYEEDCGTENDHEEDRDYRQQWPELLLWQGERCRRPSRGQLGEQLVRYTASQ